MAFWQKNGELVLALMYLKRERSERVERERRREEGERERDRREREERRERDERREREERRETERGEKRDREERGRERREGEERGRERRDGERGERRKERERREKGEKRATDRSRHDTPPRCDIYQVQVGLLENIRKDKVGNADSCSIHSALFLKHDEILTSNLRGQMKVWDLRNSRDQPSNTFMLSGDQVTSTCLTCHPTQRHLLISGDDLDSMQDRSRMFNGNETNFYYCSTDLGKVVATKGIRNVYEVDQGDAKHNSTVIPHNKEGWRKQRSQWQRDGSDVVIETSAVDAASHFAGAPRKLWNYVGRCKPDSTEDDVKRHVLESKDAGQKQKVI
ncbi:unnamed protein product [Callosobruchus maculatus]|uniref:Uncharacterized protein n=1 Tax=Callosobruchus maculatus TaxID=64391 RepID=A0A653CX11_CALMS|nr:unnamed protein product [Callosobruchus maculatus]